MNDPVWLRFLHQAQAEIEGLARQSRLFHYRAMGPDPASSFLLRFDLPYLAYGPDGSPVVQPGPLFFGVHFPPDYLRSVDPYLSLKVAVALNRDLLHPNTLGGTVCLGHDFAPGTSLRWLIFELYEIASYSNYSLVSSLDPVAAGLIRENPQILQGLLPRRPLIPRAERLSVSVESLK